MTTGLIHCLPSFFSEFLDSQLKISVVIWVNAQISYQYVVVLVLVYLLFRQSVCNLKSHYILASVKSLKVVVFSFYVVIHFVYGVA